VVLNFQAAAAPSTLLPEVYAGPTHMTNKDMYRRNISHAITQLCNGCRRRMGGLISGVLVGVFAKAVVRVMIRAT
jgi:hypothetical protein